MPVGVVDVGGCIPEPRESDRGIRLTEDPGGANRGPGDHHTRASAVSNESDRIVGSDHVTVADHRDPTDRGDHVADGVPVRAALESLHRRPTMDRDEGDARGLEITGQRRGDDRILVPPEPDLGGHGNSSSRMPIHRGDDPVDQFERGRTVAEKQ